MSQVQDEADRWNADFLPLRWEAGPAVVLPNGVTTIPVNMVLAEGSFRKSEDKALTAVERDALRWAMK